MSLSLFYDLHHWLYQMAMGSARLMPAFIILPFLNHNTLSGAIRFPSVMLVGASLLYSSDKGIMEFNNARLIMLIIKELGIGLIIAFFLSLPYWVLHAVGSMVDNQRGATLSSSLDPISGVDTSELANFFHIFAAVVILQNDGLLLILKIYEKSYLIWDPWQMVAPDLKPALNFLSILISQSLILASPIIVIFILVELCLGLLARFAPQLNAFALALTVKSIVGFLTIIIYFSPIFPGKINSLQILPGLLSEWSLKII